MDAAARKALLQRIVTMKITKKRLDNIINEEIETMIENGEIDEGILDRLKARGSGVGSKLKGAARGAVQKGLGGIAAAAGEEEMAQKMRGKAGVSKEKAQFRAKHQQVSSLLGGKLKKIKKLK